MNKSNSDNVLGNSNIPHINVKNDIPFTKFITLQKETDTDSSASINDEILDEKYKHNNIIS